MNIKKLKRYFRLSLKSSPARVRTTDPVVNSHLLCLLSYRGITKRLSKMYCREIVYINRKNVKDFESCFCIFLKKFFQKTYTIISKLCPIQTFCLRYTSKSPSKFILYASFYYTAFSTRYLSVCFSSTP